MENMLKPKRILSLILSVLMFAQSIPVQSLASVATPGSADPAGMVTQTLRLTGSNTVVSVPDGSASLSVKASVTGDGEDAADVYAENDAESAVLAVGVDRLLFTDEEGDTRFLDESEYALIDITVAEDGEARDYRVYYTDSCDTPVTGYVTETSFEGNTAVEKTYTLPEGTVSVYVAYADKGDGDLEYSVHADVYLMESGTAAAYSYFYDPTGLFDTANNVSASYAALPLADAMREKDAEIFGKEVLRNSDDFTVYHADTTKPVLYSAKGATSNYLNGWTVTANWSDGTTDYTWNAVEDDTQKPTIVIEYKVENASVQYDPGDIVITVPGIGQSGRTSDFTMSTTAGSGISEWNCTYDSSTDTYTFTNLFTVAAGVSTSGGFQMSWTINARESVTGYTMADNPTFSLGSDSITLPELTYSFTSTTDLYRIDLTYDSSEVWVPSAADDIESYMWGYAVVRYDKDILSRGLQQWKNTFTITVPSGVTADDIEFYSDAGTKVTLTKVSSTQYTCTVEGSDAIIGGVNETLETRVYIGIKKSALGSDDTVTIATHLDRLYLDETTWVTTARTNEIVDDSVTVTLADYSFDWNGYIYSTEKYSTDYEQEDHSAPASHEDRLPATAVFNDEEVMFILKGYANCQIITGKSALQSYSLNSGISTASVEEESSNENTGIVLFSASGEETETTTMEAESETEESVMTVTSAAPSFSKASALTPESGIMLLSLTSGSTVYYADKHPESAGNTTGVTKLDAYDYWYMFLGDDKLAVVLRDGSIRNLTDDEYDITKVYPSEDNWEIYAAKSQDTPFAEYEFIDSGDTASSAVSLPDGYKAVFVLYKNRVDGFEIEQQTAITVKFHLDWAEEEAKATAKQIDPEQRIINYNLFRAMYTESDGTLANDCAASSSNYGGSYGTSLAARDKELYDEYFLRSYSHVWLREIPVRYYAATEISDFTETEEDQYQATITAMGYLQSAESGIEVETFSMYSEVPDGLLLDDISLDAITFGDSSLASHATVELIENNGKQYIAVHFDYSGSPIDISELQGFSFTYNVYENGTSLAANAHQYTSYTYIMIDDEGPKSVTGGNIMADYYDIDSDGDTTELMGYGADIQLIQEDLDEWRQYVEKHVQSYYSDGYVTSTSTKLYDGNETEKSEYSYRLAFALGSNGAKNIVLYDNIETGASIAKNAATPNIYTDIDTEWNGKFLSVDTSYAESMGFTATVYYSADEDAPFDITDSAWSTAKPATVRSIAVALDTSGFTNGVFSSKNVVYVIVNMQAPSDSSLVGDVAVNQYYAVYDSYNPSTGSSLNTSYSLPSSETYVVLNNSPGELELIKVDINTREPLTGAAFNIYDSDKSLLYQGVRTDADGTINIELNPGTYYWEEKEAPEGYRQITGLTEFTVVSDTTTTITVENKEAGKLLKTYYETGAAISGGTYNVYSDSEGTNLVLGPVTTNEDGLIYLTYLEPGTYYWEETEAPEGYVRSKGLHEFTITEDGNTTQMPNYKRSDLKKVDSVTGAVLVGGVFNIYDADENLLLENVTTDANGLIQLEDMEPGTYYWEEVSAPDGYLKAVGKTEFTIEGTGNVIEIPNDPKSKLIKVDMYSKEVLASDGSFNIYDADMNLILQDVTPDADGYIELPGNTLTKGTYYWEENYAPDGYQSEGLHEITMDGSGADIEMENDWIKGIVIITKKDVEDPDGDPLPNAGYKVYMNDGAGNYVAVKAIDTGTSTDGIYEVSDDGTEEVMYTGSEAGGEYYGMLRIEGLNWGMYYYEEVEAPVGYEVNTEKEFFDVTKDNTHIRNADMTQTETPQEFSETDNQLAASVTLTKKDAEDGSVLANATFELYVKDETSNEWSKADNSYYITDDDGTFTAYINFGTYKFKEIMAPSGYKLADNEDDQYTEEFTVTAASSVTDVRISMDNERKTGSAQLYKTDPDGVILSGAKYNLYSADDTVIAEDLTTDSAGYTSVVEGLAWGSYYFLETEPPLHHELSTEKIEVTISASTVEVTQIVTAVDQHKKGSVEIIKMDDGKNVFLEGAVFSLYSSDGSLIQSGITTDTEGHAKIENLEWGSYYLIETEAPTNYLVYDGQVNFSVGADTCEIVQPVYCYDEPNLYKIIIDKELLTQYDEYGKGTFLFKITCTSGQDEGKVLYRAIDMSSSLTGSVTVTGLYAGTYEVEEISTTRYGLNETENVYGFTINGDTGETTLSDELEEAEIKFTNDIQNWEKDNHEVYVQNSVQKMRLPVSLEVTWLGPDTIESDTASEYFFTADDLTAVVSFDNDTSEDVAFSDLEFSPEWIDGSMNGSAVTVVVSYTVNGITVSDTFNVAVKLQTPLQAFRLIYDGNGGTINGNAQNAVTYKWDQDNQKQELQSGSYIEPSRVGYSFTGWYLNADGTGDTFDLDSFLAEKRDTDLTVYAAWQINSYTASFDSNGGSTVSTTITQVYNTALGTLPADPTRTGYTFAGWYTAATGGTSVTEDTLMPGYDPTYYAHWTVNSYTLTFDANGGSTASPQTITKNYGTEIGTLPTTSRTGYTFDGWYTATSGGTKLSTTDTMPAENKTYYAQWTINTFTVTLDPQSGTISSWSGGSQSGTNWVKIYDYDTTLGTLPTPTRSGYNFDGWYTEASGGTAYSSSTRVTADQTYYAHWSQQTVTVYIYVDSDAYIDSAYTTLARDSYTNLYANRYIARTCAVGSTLGSLPTFYYKGAKQTGYYVSSTNESIDSSYTITNSDNGLIIMPDIQWADPLSIKFYSQRESYYAYYGVAPSDYGNIGEDAEGDSFIYTEADDGPRTGLTINEYLESYSLSNTDILAELRALSSNAVKADSYFNGWWSAQSGGTQYTDDNVVMAAKYEGVWHGITVYAHWN